VWQRAASLFFFPAMTKEEKGRVVSTLGEKGQWIRVGVMVFHMKPLSLYQIYELGEAVNDISDDDIPQIGNVLAGTLKHHKDAKAILDACMVCLTRKSWKRKVFGRYVKRRITQPIWEKIMAHIIQSFSGNFFLTSIAFLTRTKMMTEPQETPRGL